MTTDNTMTDRTMTRLVGYTLTSVALIAFEILFIIYLLAYGTRTRKNQEQWRFLQDAKNSIFQVKFSGPLCFIVGTGINGLTRSTLLGSLRVLNILKSAEKPVELSADIVVGLIATVSGAFAGTALYLACGGKFVLPLVAIGGLSTVVVNFLHAVYGKSATVIGLWVTGLVCCHIITGWLCSRVVSSHLVDEVAEDPELEYRDQEPVSKDGVKVHCVQEESDLNDSDAPSPLKSTKSRLIFVFRWTLLQCALIAVVFIRQYALRDAYKHHRDDYLFKFFQTISYLPLIIGVSLIAEDVLTSPIMAQSPLRAWQWLYTLAIPSYLLVFYLIISNEIPVGDFRRWNVIVSGVYQEIFKFTTVGFLTPALTLLWLSFR